MSASSTLDIVHMEVDHDLGRLVVEHGRPRNTENFDPVLLPSARGAVHAVELELQSSQARTLLEPGSECLGRKSHHHTGTARPMQASHADVGDDDAPTPLGRKQTLAWQQQCRRAGRRVRSLFATRR